MTLLAAAITPPGRGAIAIIHVCGVGAGSLVSRLFPKEISDQPRHGMLKLEGEVLDEVMVRTAPGFTGEETVEISCHGGVTVDRVLSALKTLGARHVGERELLEKGVETGPRARIVRGRTDRVVVLRCGSVKGFLVLARSSPLLFYLLCESH